MRTFHRLLLLCAMLPVTAAACESARNEVFRDFFARYASDRVFMLARVVHPPYILIHRYGSDGHDVRKRIYTRAEWAKTETVTGFAQENGMVADRMDIGPAKAKVSVEKPGTDWVVDYHFRRRGRCWYFHHFETVDL